MRIPVVCLALCARGLDVTPESLELFSAHPGVVLHSIELQNPSSEDVVVSVSISRRTAARRLSKAVEDSQPARCDKPRRLLARLRAGERDAYRRRLREELSATWRHLPRLDLEILETCEPEMVLSEMRQKYDSLLEFVEMDQVVQLNAVPNDPDFHRLWALEKIRTLEAWSKLKSLGLYGEETVVAVIDTGVQLDHPDLKDSLWRNVAEIPNNGIDDDGNGYVDDVHGYDFADEDGAPEDDNGHGTHCAGILAATANNGVGISGVASGLGKVRIMALRFIDADGHGGTVSDAVRALEYALSFNVPVSSSSWGGPDTSTALKIAIEEATKVGHLFVAAAGNSGRNIADGTYYPCVYRQAGVLCVAATDQDDHLTTFSNYASQYVPTAAHQRLLGQVEIAAPGIDIYSSYMGSGYRSEFGTSMSTPFVAGAAALVVSAFGYSGTDVRQLLLDSAVLQGAYEGKVDGGRLDLLALVHLSEQRFLFWLDSPDGKTASQSVTLKANSSNSLTLRLGAENLSTGTYEAQVSLRWPGGEKLVPVVYRLQGSPQLELLEDRLEWPQVLVNITVNQSLIFRNSGNGTGRALLHLSYPFTGPREVQIPAASVREVQVACAANGTGEWEEQAYISTNSGLGPFDASRAEALELGRVLNVSLKCTSKEPPHLAMEPVSGVAEVVGPQLHFFQSVVHAEWEPFVAGSLLRAQLVLPDENNSLGCKAHSDVAGSVILVARGECYFVLKAQMASQANASGVLLYDSQDAAGMPLLAMPRDAEIPKIPMFMVTKADGEALAKRLLQEPVEVELRWDTVTAYSLPSRPGRVSLNISNQGVASMYWHAQVKPSFTTHSFYEASYPGAVHNETLPFSWAKGGEELSYLTLPLQRRMPFNFSFFGEIFEELWVNSSSLTFGSQMPVKWVKGFADLACNGCRISETIDRCYSIQYANMSLSTELISFEIRLCPDGQIHLIYADVSSPPLDSFIGLASLEQELDFRDVLPFQEKTFVASFKPWLSAVSVTQGVLQQDETVELQYDVYAVSGQNGIIRVIGQDESGFWQSQRDVRLVQERFAFEIAGGAWEACLAYDCDLNSGIRRRGLECVGMDGLVYPDACLSPTASCRDSFTEWRDKDGARCQEYELEAWCSPDGYGAGWKSNWGTFEDFSFGALDASMVCCACGGGVRSEPPHTEELCSNDVVAADTDCDGIIDCLDPCPLHPGECTTTASGVNATDENATFSAPGAGCRLPAAASGDESTVVDFTGAGSGSIWPSIFLPLALMGLAAE